MPKSTVIATWFVADTAETATFFAQVGSRSDAPAAQATYWRCILCFYASTMAQNPDARHIFFTNTAVPHVDGIDLAERLSAWDVEVVTLPITYRLPKGVVGSWGNQFYIFDIIDWLAGQCDINRAIVLDSDCVWLRSATDMEAAIDEEGALTYTLDNLEHPAEEAINGLSRQGMARFLSSIGGPVFPAISYYGGEIYAASHATTVTLAAEARRLWPLIEAQVDDAPLEEAHFLSVLYSKEGIRGGTANRFLRRMWTTFKHNNLALSDLGLHIWHLPAEKRTGFADLFERITRDPTLQPTRDATAMGLTVDSYSRCMGFPKRGLSKLIRDGGSKIREKLSP